MMKNLSPCFSKWVLFFSLLLLLSHFVSSKKNGRNPADEIVDIINQNRTTHRLTKLSDSPGLGCMALQYVKFCKGNCSDNNAGKCKPPDDDFTEIFAPNCGVELPTIGTITGHIIGCRSKYMNPDLAFTDVLVKDEKALSVMRNKSHTEVGVGWVGFHHKGPFFWCVLFGNGKTNSTFVLEDGGKGIKQKKGCYSGSSFQCSNTENKRPILWRCILSITLSCFFLSKQLYNR